MTIEPEYLEFESEGATLRGRFHKSVAPDAPLVVMAHGFSATAHMSINAFALRLSDAGHHVFAYDHRNFGTIDGEPRFAVGQ